MLWWALGMGLLLLQTVAGGGEAPSGDAPRDLGYEPYPESTSFTDSRWQYSPTSSECGGLLRPLLAGVLLGALVKIPLLILGKILLLKAAAPLAVAGALVPLGIFTIYRAAMMGQSGGGGGGSSNSTSRMLPHGCLMAAACNIGSASPKASVATTSWLLKSIGQAADRDWGAEGQVYLYREAYMKGAASKSCPEYPCPFF